MTDSFLLSRILLTFQSGAEDLLTDLSAIARTPDGSLWLGSDEYLTLERLMPMGDGIYGNHQSIPLKDFVKLSEDQSEIDIEGLDYADGYLWLVGSHSWKRGKPKGKKVEKDIKRLAEIRSDSNRYFLARLPVLNGEIVPTYAVSDDDDETRSVARLQPVDDHNVLMEAIASDPHLGPFLSISLPSKENGLDIEGLAVRGDRIFLGLRGPVLRGWAIILELELEETSPGTLSLKPIGKDCSYRKHFLYLNGQGIRDLCFHGKELLILAGPTMDVDGTMQVFCLSNFLDNNEDMVWSQDSGHLRYLFDLPLVKGADRAEGLTLIPCLGYEDSLMIVYDSPDPRRCPHDRAIFADVFRLPSNGQDEE